MLRCQNLVLLMSPHRPGYSVPKLWLLAWSLDRYLSSRWRRPSPRYRCSKSRLPDPLLTSHSCASMEGFPHCQVVSARFDGREYSHDAPARERQLWWVCATLGVDPLWCAFAGLSFKPWRTLALPLTGLEPWQTLIFATTVGLCGD